MSIVAASMLFGLIGCSGAQNGGAPGRTSEPGTIATKTPPAGSGVTDASGASTTTLEKPKEEWQKLLPAESYHVMFEQGTELAGSSPLNGEARKGTFVCAACFLPLFNSDTKYESGTGWPSFFDAIPGRLGTTTDHDIGYPRTEYHCIRCGGHQGHIFDDGPRPTGMRYCNNGVALRFVPDGESLPELRS